MEKQIIISWQWLFQMPPLMAFASVQQPDIELLSMFHHLKFNGPILEAIRQRAILYSKAGCPKVACVKSAVRDLLK